MVCVKIFKDEGDFPRVANDSEFGLMAGAFTQDIDRAMRLSVALDSGVVGINFVSYINIQASFRGSRQSATGRDMSHISIAQLHRAQNRPGQVSVCSGLIRAGLSSIAWPTDESIVPAVGWTSKSV